MSNKSTMTMLALYQLRVSQGLTKIEMAERLDMSERHYRRLENGQSPISRVRADSIRARFPS